MDDLEARLRSALDLMTRDVEPSAELDERVASAVRRPGRAPRWTMPLALAAAVTLLLGAVALVARDESRRPVVTAGDDVRVAEVTGWESSAPSPLSPRVDASVVWTGREAIVWGGRSSTDAEVGFADGAAYDPALDRWRKVAEAPLVGRYAHVAVWTGREMIVIGGESGRRTDGAAYDPVADRWRPLANGPLASASVFTFGRVTAVWTGREVAVWGRIPDTGTTLNQGAAYDPATDRWRPLPSLPGVRSSGSLFATPQGILAFGRAAGPKPFDPAGATIEGDLLRPGSSTWEALPSAVSQHGNPLSVWTGTELVVWGSTPKDPVAAGLRVSARYSSTDGTWRPAADLPSRAGARAVAWAGREAVLVQGRTASAYDPARDRWRELPALPAAEEPRELRLLWAGPSVLLWTGAGFVVGG